MTIPLLLVALALIFTVVAAAGRFPLWPAVLLLTIVELMPLI